MRAIGKHKFLSAENGNAARAGGRLTLVTVDPKTNVADVFVGYLRRKIDGPFGRRSLETVRGVGYRVRADA